MFSFQKLCHCMELMDTRLFFLPVLDIIDHYTNTVSAHWPKKSLQTVFWYNQLSNYFRTMSCILKQEQQVNRVFHQKVCFCNSISVHYISNALESSQCLAYTSQLLDTTRFSASIASNRHSTRKMRLPARGTVQEEGAFSSKGGPSRCIDGCVCSLL